MIAPARRAAFSALVEIARGRADLDEALDRARQTLGDARDVGLLRELVTGTLRWQSRLDWRLAPFSRVAMPKLDVEVLVALRMAAYQLDHLDRVPASAIVHDAVALVRAAKKSSAAGLVNAVLRALTRAGRTEPPVAPPSAPPAEVAAALAVSTAHPAWLVERWLAREPRDVVEAWLHFDNEPPPTTLRVNPLSGATRDGVAARLAADGIVTTPAIAAPLGLVVREGLVVAHPALATGLCGIQDEGSQLAALVAPVAPGARVLDVCAAPGGKTLAYAWAAGAEGHVVACDVRERRLAVLRETLHRGHAGGAAVVAIDETAPLPFAPVFDVVAVDAPCSGLGTLRRDPDIKWRRTAEDLRRYQARQVGLLTRAAAVVAPGGALVYTTCSTEPEENLDVVRQVLSVSPDFTLRRADAGPGGEVLTPFVDADGCLRTHPARHGLEGYFGAVLVRRADGPRPAAVVQ
ncbi:MAG: 16S rRNA (cytosine(967)-C(5))-methyltransferase RsmB [Acidobacteria bacterium]|nr:16S rRNA (cytosine(967)-C(5))-methyltransferase RsmB [Acidobacteriota bacterium]